MNKILACFLLIAVLSSVEGSFWDSLKNTFKYGWEKIAQPVISKVADFANDYILNNPIIKKIKDEFLPLGEEVAINVCKSYFAEDPCRDVIHKLATVYQYLPL